MKRSTWLRLCLMGAGGAYLSGCSDSSEQETVIYKTAKECIDAGVFSAETCEAQYQQAKALAEQDAPRYSGQNQCEGDFGYNQCYRQDNGFWSPFMAGFMMSTVTRAVAEGISGQGARYYYDRKRQKEGLLRPVYRTSDDYFHYRTSANIPVGQVGRTAKPYRVNSSILTTFPTDKGKVIRSSGSYGTKAKTISRGGFGKSGSVRGGWGG